MRRGLARREVALFAVALLAGVIALAVVSKTRSDSTDLPAAYGSYPAWAGAADAASIGKHTACGTVIRPRTQGVGHPVLPCGARIYITYNGKHVLTQVIDRGPNRADREFELTPALAKLVGLTGVQRIRWSYAAAG